MKALDTSALHIKRSLEAAFPTPPIRQYISGNVVLTDEPKHLQYLCFRPVSQKGKQGFDDLTLDVGKGRCLLVWKSDDGEVLRLLVGGSDHEVKALRLALRDATKKGHIRAVESVKLKR